MTSPEAAFVRLFVADVQAHPSHFNADVRANPEAWARRSVEGHTATEVKRLTQELAKEVRTVGDPRTFRIRVNLNDDGFVVAARALPTGGFDAVLGFEKHALRFPSNDEAIQLIAQCRNVDAATIEPGAL